MTYSFFPKIKIKIKKGEKMNSNLESHGHGKGISKRWQGGGFDGGDWSVRADGIGGAKEEKECGLRRKEREEGRFSDGGSCSAATRS